MQIDKKVINYYYSFFEVSKELNKDQFYDFNMAIYKVMFFEVHIDDIEFDDTMLTILWKSVKHSLQASIKGFCDKKSIPYNEIFAPLDKPLSKPLTNNDKRTKIMNKDNEQCIIKQGVKKEFTFSLKTQKLLSDTNKEYQSNLMEYINNSGKQMTYIDFYNQCEMKPYKYKNFKMAFDSWTKKDKQQLKSFRDQDRERTDNIAQVVLNEGINPFDPANYQQQEEFTDVQLTN